jgi:hypothetical protein
MSERHDGNLYTVFRRHPALLVSAFYVAASFIGMFYSWAYLRRFGINVFNYAQLSDFLLASLKEPFIWTLVVFATVLIHLDNASSRRFERRGPSKWFGWYGSPRYRMANNVGAFFLILVFLYTFATLQVRETRGGNAKQVDVIFADGDAMQTSALLGTTGQFIFLYDADAERVNIHPIESIHSISFQAN